MNYINETRLKNDDGSYNVIIEIIKGTKNKTELIEPFFNKLETVTKVSKKYPYYYGCFPQTLAGDGDPLDMILLTEKKRKPLDIINVIPIGMIITNDCDQEDNKILVVDKNEDIKNLAKLVIRCYSFLEKVIAKNKRTTLNKKIFDSIEAIKIIEYSNKRYNNNKKQDLKIII